VSRVALPTLPRPSLPSLPSLPRVTLPPLRIPWRRDRRVAVAADRLHLELRDLTVGEVTDLAALVEPAVAELPGVRWVQVHGATHRLVVCGAAADTEVAQVLARCERELGVDHRPFRTHPEHPADWEPLSLDLVGLAADLTGIVLGAAAQATRLRPPPVEIDLAALLNVADQVVPVRRTIERRIGVPATDLLVGFTNAVLQGITQGPLGPMVDLAHRVQLFNELTARRQAWLERERELFERPSALGAQPPPRLERPAPVPEGPIERYSAGALLASIAGATAGTLWSRRLTTGAAVLQAGMPRAARIGREGFASQLSRHLADHGVVVLDPEPLRLLDRLDRFVVDAALFAPGRLDADQFATAARKAAIGLVVAGTPVDGLPDGVDNVSRRRLVDVVQALQRDGHVVCLVVARPDPAVGAADLTLGLHTARTEVPWGSHLVATDDAVPAFLLLEAAAEARRVSNESVRLATIGAGAATLLAFGALAPTGTARAPSAVSVAAALSLTNGVRHAYDLVRLPLPLRADPTPWHALDVDTVLDRLGTSADGLTPEAAAARLVPEPPPVRLPVAFARAVAGEIVNPLTPILAAGAALSALVGSVADAGLVASVVVANGLVGGVQQLRAERAVAALSRTHASDVLTMREGTPVPIAPKLLVQGDVIRLEAGQVVPADCRLVVARAVEVDESALTGESLPVAKSDASCDAVAVADRTSMLYEGTWIAAGEAAAVVVATGADTEARRALRLAGEPPVSGVEARLRSWTGRMVPLALVGGGVVVLSGLMRGRPMRETVGAGVSLAVAAVPEGLPLLATVAQLSAARRLSKRQVLVRNPRAVEALGRVDVVCADKTGTLTEGRIALQVVSDGDEEATLDGLDDHFRAVLKGAVRATPSADDPALLPHPTDRAVAEGGASNGLEVVWEPDDVLPFEPGRSYHAALGATSRGVRVEVKGAPEVVLPRCARWQRRAGVSDLDDVTRERLGQHVDAMARRGLRVLAVAEGHLDDGGVLDDDRVRDLKLLGFVGLADPARQTAADAVALLRRAGARVLMITGDHPSTAAGIGAELGLLDGGRVATGTELDASDDDALAALLDEVSVFARVTPSHKVRIVKALQRHGHVVAMTGDGANDAPAIRLADVGIALGQRSTTAAQSAADLVVLDERIETIVDAVVEGRALWTSVRDAVAVLVGGNVGEIIFTVAGSVLTGLPPLNARQLLLVNLLTDAAPALAIAMRPPPHTTPERLLHEGPDLSLGAALDQAIAWRAGTTAAATGLAWALGSATGTRAHAGTVALVALTGAQLGQTLATGGRDPVVLAAGLGSAAVLAAVVQTPGLSHLFGCRPLGPSGWAIATTCATAAAVSSVVLPRLVHRNG
jgi:cation-transporting ATPase I